MTKKHLPDDPTDVEALARAIEAMKALPMPPLTAEKAGPQHRSASLLSLEIALRHSPKGNRRAHARLAYGGRTAAALAAPVPGTVPQAMANRRLSILDIGRAGALVLDRGEAGLADSDPLASGPEPLPWLDSRIVAQRGPLLHVAFPPDRSEAEQASLEALLATLGARDTGIGRKMARLSGWLAQRCATLDQDGSGDALWSDTYVTVAGGRFVSPASTALDPLVGADLMQLVTRLPWPAVVLMVDCNGHIAVALGDQITRKSWRGTFTEIPALLLAARFALEPALAAITSPADAGEAFWLASAPLAIGERRWGCLAVMTPIRAPECAGPSPA